MAKVGNLVFPNNTDIRMDNREVDANFRDITRWAGPQDLVESDEIEMLGTIKVEQQEESAEDTGSLDCRCVHIH